MKTVETRTPKFHRLAITVDLNDKQEIIAAINLLTQKLHVPLLTEEQSGLWARKMEKRYKFSFIKAYSTVKSVVTTQAKVAIEEAEDFDDLGISSEKISDFWKEFYLVLSRKYGLI